MNSRKNFLLTEGVPVYAETGTLPLNMVFPVEGRIDSTKEITAFYTMMFEALFPNVISTEGNIDMTEGKYTLLNMYTYYILNPINYDAPGYSEKQRAELKSLHENLLKIFEDELELKKVYPKNSKEGKQLEEIRQAMMEAGAKLGANTPAAKQVQEDVNELKTLDLNKVLFGEPSATAIDSPPGPLLQNVPFRGDSKKVIEVAKQLSKAIADTKFEGKRELLINEATFDEINKTFSSHNLAFPVTWEQFSAVWPSLTQKFVKASKNNHKNENFVNAVQDELVRKVDSLEVGIYSIFVAAFLIRMFVNEYGEDHVRVLPNLTILLQSMLRGETIDETTFNGMSAEQKLTLYFGKDVFSFYTPSTSVATSWNQYNWKSYGGGAQTGGVSWGRLAEMATAALAVASSTYDTTTKTASNLYSSAAPVISSGYQKASSGVGTAYNYTRSGLSDVYDYTAPKVGSLIDTTTSGLETAYSGYVVPAYNYTSSGVGKAASGVRSFWESTPDATLPSTYWNTGSTHFINAANIPEIIFENTTFTAASPFALEPKSVDFEYNPANATPTYPSPEPINVTIRGNASLTAPPVFQYQPSQELTTARIPKLTTTPLGVENIGAQVSLSLSIQGITLQPQHMLIAKQMMGGNLVNCGESCNAYLSSVIPYEPFFTETQLKITQGIRALTRREVDIIVSKYPQFQSTAQALSSSKVFETFFTDTQTKIRIETGGKASAIDRKKEREVRFTDTQVNTALLDIANEEGGYVLGDVTLVFDEPKALKTATAPTRTTLQTLVNYASTGLNAVVTALNEQTAADINLPPLVGWAVQFHKRTPRGDYTYDFTTFINADNYDKLSPLSRGFILKQLPELKEALLNFQGIDPRLIDIRVAGHYSNSQQVISGSVGTLQSFLIARGRQGVEELKLELTTAVDRCITTARPYTGHSDETIRSLAVAYVNHAVVMKNTLESRLLSYRGQEAAALYTEVYTSFLDLDISLDKAEKNKRSDIFKGTIANITTQILNPVVDVAAGLNSVYQGTGSGIKSAGDFAGTWLAIAPFLAIIGFGLGFGSSYMGKMVDPKDPGVISTWGDIKALLGLVPAVARGTISAIGSAAISVFPAGYLMSVEAAETHRPLIFASYVGVYLTIMYGGKAAMKSVDAYRAVRNFFKKETPQTTQPAPQATQPPPLAVNERPSIGGKRRRHKTQKHYRKKKISRKTRHKRRKAI